MTTTYDRGVLRLRADLLDVIVAHARAEHPVEACGVLAGPVGGELDEHIPMVNFEYSRMAYQFDPEEQLRLWCRLDAAGRAPVVIYHSHTATSATPSRSDVRLAMYPNIHYVIVSTRDPRDYEVRSWRIAGGHVTEEPIEVVPLALQ